MVMREDCWPAETAAALNGIVELVERLRAASPELEKLLEPQRVQVTFRASERVLLFSTVRPNGTSVAVVAIDGNPDSPEFGSVGVPVPHRAVPASGTYH